MCTRKQAPAGTQEGGAGHAGHSASVRVQINRRSNGASCSTAKIVVPQFMKSIRDYWDKTEQLVRKVERDN